MESTNKTIIVFSGDLDKAMAAFIIANGAAAMGDEVTMFFTFWGLNMLRKPEKVKTSKKSFLQAMFGKMMPRGADKLGLSKMNFGGMGAKMMKLVMKQQNVTSIQELIESAREQGVKMIACNMSMDVMGIKEEELIDGLEFAGVATYLNEADQSNVNLFI
nr:DsrE/DsrF/DrsH-like family protein [Desulfolucanica intricata]